MEVDINETAEHLHFQYQSNAISDKKNTMKDQ